VVVEDERPQVLVQEGESSAPGLNDQRKPSEEGVARAPVVPVGQRPHLKEEHRQKCRSPE
jgi:hypothetical protein